MEELSIVEKLLAFFNENTLTVSVLGPVIVAFLSSGLFSFSRRPKKVSQGGGYFTSGELLSPPMARPAYSDRMAYVLAEMSSLAYFEFEGSGGVMQKAVEDFLKITHDPQDQAQSEILNLLKIFADDLLIKSVDSKEFLARILEKSNFKLLDTVNINSTQAFVCKRTAQDETPYLVVAYRGTEMVISDWLTDAKAVPTIDKGLGTKVHTGFLEALTSTQNAQQKSVLESVREILEGAEAKDGNEALPLFITGHSLGGALALLTTRELAPDINGACYTYGAPRVANYEYYKDMKTPVFRVVNSSDIVPRVPPGAIMGVLLKLIQGISWVTMLVPGVAKPLAKLEHWVDMLNGYRHYGDQRYMTDVTNGRFHTVRLLSNPPLIDRITWMWQHIRVSFLSPVKSHGMAIYRKKLNYIARSRN